jgi:hypothetical protein
LEYLVRKGRRYKQWNILSRGLIEIERSWGEYNIGYDFMFWIEIEIEIEIRLKKAIG